MAQTTVTSFFQSRKRNFDSNAIKKVNINSSKNKQDKCLEEVVPAKVGNFLTPKLTNKEDYQGLTLENENSQETALEKGFIGEIKLETPKSSQSIPNLKTPLRQGGKKRGAPGIKRVPKRRKLDLGPAEGKSIKNFFNTISKESETTSEISVNQEASTSKEMPVLQKEVDVVKVRSKSSVTVTLTPIKTKNVENSVVKQSKHENMESAKVKKPSIDEIKAKLKTCGKLQELKQCLSKINESSAKLKEINVKKKNIFQSSSPIKLPSPHKSPNKVPLHLLVKDVDKIPHTSLSSPTKVPAYERFHNLASKDTDKQLTLPLKYQTLAEFFRCLDMVVGMLHNRKEVCTFDKVKSSVQQIVKRVFDKNKLAQIKTVFPRAYFYSLETVSKLISGPKSNNAKTLVITPNFQYDENSDTKKSGEPKKLLDPTVMAERKIIFHKHLVEITKKHHEVFLSGLNPPISLKNDCIMRWHPKFKLDEVPEIEPSPLPEVIKEKVQTAQDVLEKMNLGGCPRVQKALEMVVKNKVQVKEALKAAPTKNDANLKALKGISQSLIDKIKAKESAKIMREMLRNPESERKLEMLQRLPEFTSMLRSYFIQEKKAAIVMEDAVNKLFESYRTSISQIDVEDHIRLLAKTLPDWLSLIQIRKGLFLKIDKTKDLGVLKKRIEEAIKKERDD